MNTTIDLPDLNEFLTFDKEKIKNFCSYNNITTSYLPVDGTRRHFILFNSNVSSWNEENLKDYYKHVNNNFQGIISLFFDFGIKNLIILLMDKSAFTRGQTFLKETISNGIKPLFEDQTYLDLYESYNIDVYFSGFTSVYNTYYDEEVLKDLEENFGKLKKYNGERKLIVYTGLSPSEDYLLLEQYAQDLRRKEIPLTKKNLIERIYQTDLPKIDFTIWFGFPRDKIIPPLLWEDGINFYIKNPTLTLKPAQIKKAIYYTALSKDSIKDKYIFHSFTEEEKINELQQILESDSIMGQEYYH